MTELLCKFAYWILDKFEPTDLWETRIRTKTGTYKVYSVTQNNDFSKITLEAMLVSRKKVQNNG